MQKPYQVILQSVYEVSDILELCLFAAVSEEKVPIYSFLLNVFEHKIEVIMSWQIYREVPTCMWILRIRLRQPSSDKFWNLKAGSLVNK